MDSVPRICLVTADREPADSPDARLAELLASAGWDVHVLACSPGPRPVVASAGVRVSHLDDFPEGPVASVPEWAGGFDRVSLHVLAVLQHLHAATPFDIIQYPEEGALGFRAAQAKRSGSGLDGAFLVARLRGPSAWRRTHEARWPTGPHEAVRDFAEQTSFELADGHTSQSEYLLDEARRLGWAVPPGAVALPNYPAPVPRSASATGVVGEVVFVGPLDKLHGLRVFVRAVQTLPTTVPIGFIGPDPLIEGKLASLWAGERLKGRRVSMREVYDQSLILNHLRDRNRLAVVPYLSATDVEFVRTLAYHGIPFLVADYGPAAELVADDDARANVMFPASVSGLSRALADYLAAPVARRRAWVERLAEIHGSNAVRPAILGYYERALAEARANRVACAIPAAPRATSKVTVGITHFNLGQFLPATLASVAAQTHPNLEVVIADDGSTDPASVAVVDEMERLYPTFRFLRGANVGVSGNRNRCLDAATGELFFPLDADNIAAPDMIEKLVAALDRQPPDVGAISCFWLGFQTDEDLKAGRFCGSYRPTGGPRVAVGLWNPYGETSGLYRTRQLRDLGGYDDLHPEYMSEDWHLYIKIVASGLKVAVIPKALYFYRIRNDSRYRTGDHGVNHLWVLPDVAAIPFSPSERLEVWTMLAGMMYGAELAREERRAIERERVALEDRLQARRYRMVDGFCSALRRVAVVLRCVAAVRGAVGYVARKGRRVCGRLKRLVMVSGRR